MNTIEHGVARPFPEVIIDRGVWRKIFWQLPPLATRAIYIADCVEHLAHVCLALASACAGRRDHRLDDSPLLVAHITRITSNSRLVHLALFVRPHGSPLLSPNRLPYTESQGILMVQELSKQALRPDDKAQSVIPEPTPRPDAKAAIALDCSGLLQGWNQCLLTASNTCGSKGYTILDRSGQNPTQPNESTFTRSMHIHNKAPKTTSLRSNVS